MGFIMQSHAWYSASLCEHIMSRYCTYQSTGTVTPNLYRVPNLYRLRNPYVIHSKPAWQQTIESNVAWQPTDDRVE
ncbi:unnamed protein product [Arctogadus glacialis]